ncbi:MAG: hypothetical protein RIC55_21415 [Pirellulaceae bacterium]
MKTGSGPTSDRRWLRCRNVETSDVEPYTLLQIVGASDVRGRTVVEVEPADRAAGFMKPLAALGPARLPSGALGHCTMQWPAWVRTTGDVEAGAMLGPLNSHIGEIGPLGQGFVAQSAAVGEPARALVSFGPQYFRAKKVRFGLGEGTLETTDAFNLSATAANRWDGLTPPRTEHISVGNLPISQNHMFSGGPNQFGLASYDILFELYWIMTMECPS